MTADSKTRCSFVPTPISGDCFVGRTDLIAHLIEQATLDLPPLLSVDGPLKIGRTSLLRHIEDLSAGTAAPGIALRHYFGRRDAILAVAVSLRRVRRSPGTLERQLLSQVAQALKRFEGFEEAATAIRPDEDGALERLADLLRDQSRPFLLMLDDAEILLGADESDQRWKDEVDMHLGTLHEYVSRSDLLFAFGPTDEDGPIDPASRRQREREYLVNVSRFFGLKIDRRPLGLLDPADTVGYSARVLSDAAFDGAAAEEGLARIAEYGGTHPLLINVVGIEVIDLLRAGKELSDDAILSRVEDRLEGFMRRVVTTVGSDAEATDALLAVAESGEGTFLPEDAEFLAGEALVRITTRQAGDRHCVMDAAILRYSLPRMVGRVRAEVDSASSTEVPVYPIYAARGIHRTPIALTDVEYQLMRRLLENAGETVSRATLLKLLPRGDAGDPARVSQRLNQRLSSLRKKLRDALDANDEVIEPVYGKGYRLVRPERFKLD